MGALVPILLPMLPGLIESAATIYRLAAAAPETAIELKAHYARIAAELDALTILVLQAPEPPEGSGA